MPEKPKPDVLYEDDPDHRGWMAWGFTDPTAKLRSAAIAMTFDLSDQFIGGGRIGEPPEAQVELLKEAGRLLFLRGLVVRGEAKVTSFSGTIRTLTAR